MATPGVLDGVDALVSLGADEVVAVLCSEWVWLRCHRRLLADHPVLDGEVAAVHLMHDGRLSSRPHGSVRLAGEVLVYDVGATTQLPNE